MPLLAVQVTSVDSLWLPPTSSCCLSLSSPRHRRFAVVVALPSALPAVVVVDLVLPVVVAVDFALPAIVVVDLALYSPVPRLRLYCCRCWC
ncbi:hypothetical protein EDB84DRAFT_1495080 [Lactarius hengduanensis]|nr:hypothetical protein EDB84DRAFT_1528289 [Lactarius hengduanensis]KAH9030195.1 hypothetical protein EDB84DRAFT_1495080 [Lactarius hengduanensis]